MQKFNFYNINMKKTLFMVMALMLAGTGRCLSQDAVTTATYGHATGNTERTMTMALTHTADYVAFSAELLLPEGTTVTAINARTPLKNGGTINMSSVGGSATESTDFRVPFRQVGTTCRVMGYNLGEMKIAGNTGDILVTITLTTTEGINYNTSTVTASNITFVTDDMREVTLPNAITSSRLWGDVNVDQAVDGKDYQVVTNIAVGTEVVGADLFAADIVVDAEETIVDAKDAQRLSNVIVGK